MGEACEDPAKGGDEREAAERQPSEQLSLEGRPPRFAEVCLEDEGGGRGRGVVGLPCVLFFCFSLFSFSFFLFPFFFFVLFFFFSF